jgi:membrane-associated protein
MHWLRLFVGFVLHLDKHLGQLTQDYGSWTYAILVAIVFCETGLVVTPFLPGDSLLFAAGAVAALGSLDVTLMAALLVVAAVVGDTVNYHIGQRLGPRVMRSETSRLFNRAHLLRTQRFFERHGGKTIIIARFVPIVRTFAPFVAGAGAMRYPRFIAFNVIGGVSWVALFVTAGYLFGNLPMVRKNFTLVIFAIIVVSVLPGLVEYYKARRAGAVSSSAQI